MILQSLYELYDRLKADDAYMIAPPGWSRQKVSLKIVLTPAGNLSDIQDARIKENGKPRSRQIFVPGKTKPSGSGLNPCFLWDNTAYALAYEVEEEKRARARKSFEAFKSKHLELETEIGSKAFSAVCRFLEGWEPAQADDYPILEEVQNGFVVFQIEGESSFVHEDQAVTTWWQQHSSGNDHVVEGQCLITGNLAPVARLHEPKIKGVRGSQGAGATIVGFNSDAFESYGKKSSFNAPVSEEAVRQYTTALNALLDGPMSFKHRLSLGDATIAFWTTKPTIAEDIFAKFASEGSAVLEDKEVQDEETRQKLEAFLRALRKGREAYGELDHNTGETRFYMLGMTGQAGGRIGIRFFHSGKLGELLDNLRKHYSDIKVEPQPAGKKRQADPEFPPAWLLLAQTARESKEIPPILSGSLLRSIITGARYPQALYSAVIRRIHADRKINYARACVIKGYLVRNLKKEVPMSLDKERKDPAYRLGRLFAALEKTQLDALGGKLNATIRDRFYSSASATPGSVFPRLLRTYQHHLAKMEGGFKVNREKLVQEIMDPLTGFPTHLNLAEQGLFAIGYYHQTRNFYQRKETDSQSE